MDELGLQGAPAARGIRMSQRHVWVVLNRGQVVATHPTLGSALAVDLPLAHHVEEWIIDEQEVSA